MGIVAFCSWGFQGESPTDRYLAEPIQERPFDPEAWQKAKEGIDFRDEMRVDRRDEDFFTDSTTQAQRRITEGGGGSGNTWLGYIFKFLMVLGAVALLAFLLNQFLGSGGIRLRRNRRFSSQPLNINLERVEAELIESDLDRMLRQALENKNYPLALRLKYLAVIKGLYLNGYTRWKKDKTNRQYLREIDDPQRKEEFRQLTLAFERIWYGRGQIDLHDYQQLAPSFDRFLQQVEANPIKIHEPVNG